MDVQLKLVELAIIAATGYLFLAIIFINKTKPWASKITNNVKSTKNKGIALTIIFSILLITFCISIQFRFANASVATTVWLLILQILELIPFFFLGLAFCKEINFEALRSAVIWNNNKSVIGLLRSYLFIALITIIIAVSLIGFEQLIKQWTVQPTLSAAQTNSFADPFSKLFGYRLSLITIFLLILPSIIAEEGIFRLGILSYIYSVSNKKHLAVIISAFLFSLVHFLPSHPINAYIWSAPLLHFGGLMLAGSLYGYIFLWRRFEFVVIFHTLIVFVPFIMMRS